MTPLPGDPDVLEAYVANYTNTANAIKGASRELANLANPSLYVSKAVTKLADVAKDSSVDTAGLYARYKGGSTAVSGYAVRLRAAQSRARDAIAAHYNASDEISTLTHKRDDYLEQARQPGQDREELLRLAAILATEIGGLEFDRRNAESEWVHAVEDRDSAAREAKSQLEEVSRSSNLQDSAFDKIWDAGKEVYKWAQEKVAPILKILKDVAKKMSEVVGFIALVLSILSVFLPFLAPFAAGFALASTILSIIAIVAVLLLAVLGRGSWKDAFKEVIGLALKSIVKKIVSPLSKLLPEKIAKAALAKFTIGTLGKKFGPTSVYQMVDVGVKLAVKESIKFGTKPYVSFIKDHGTTPLADLLFSPKLFGANVSTPSWNPPAVQPINMTPTSADITPAGISTSFSEAIMSGPFRQPSQPILAHAGGGGFAGR